MDGLTLSDVIASTHGHWTGRDDPSAIVPTGVSIDTRTLKPGDLFFALPGEEVDGHQFLDAAFENGACATVVSKFNAQASPQARLIVVDEPDLALGNLARVLSQAFRHSRDWYYGQQWQNHDQRHGRGCFEHAVSGFIDTGKPQQQTGCAAHLIQPVAPMRLSQLLKWALANAAACAICAK